VGRDDRRVGLTMTVYGRSMGARARTSGQERQHDAERGSVL
jgi:hypothetical protein